jgi:hypothetical protein
VKTSSQRTDTNSGDGARSAKILRRGLQAAGGGRRRESRQR